MKFKTQIYIQVMVLVQKCGTYTWLLCGICFICDSYVIMVLSLKHRFLYAYVKCMCVSVCVCIHTQTHTSQCSCLKCCTQLWMLCTLSLMLAAIVNVFLYIS